MASDATVKRVIKYLQSHDVWNGAATMAKDLNITRDILSQIAREYDDIIEVNFKMNKTKRSIYGYRLKA